MRAAAGAISRARARARAHHELLGDGLELWELQGGQIWVITHLTHAWPRASSAAGRLGAMPAVAARALRGERRARAR